MAKRLIQTVQVEGNPRVVKIYRDTEWNEWQCVMACDGVELSRAYEDSKADALGTAKAMLAGFPQSV